RPTTEKSRVSPSPAREPIGPSRGLDGTPCPSPACGGGATDEPEVMQIYSLSVSVDGFIADREGAFELMVPMDGAGVGGRGGRCGARRDRYGRRGRRLLP